MTPLTVDPATNTGMPMLYSPPSDVGADRIVNAVAALRDVRARQGDADHRRGFRHRDHLRCHFADGEYVGGVICPGIGISADALFQRAARLPRVDVRKPPAVIGQTTVTSMQSGLFFGYVSMVDGIVTPHSRRDSRAASRRSASRRGAWPVSSRETSAIQRVDPELTLRGAAADLGDGVAEDS